MDIDAGKSPGSNDPLDLSETSAQTTAEEEKRNVLPFSPIGNGDGRDSAGRFLPGNQAARQHGTRAVNQPVDVLEAVR